MKKKALKVVIATGLMISLFAGTIYASSPDLISRMIDSLMVKISTILPANSSAAMKTLDTETNKVIADIKKYNDNFQKSISTEITNYKNKYTSQKVQELKDIQNQYQKEMDSRKQGIIDSITNDLKSNIDKEYQKSLDKMEQELTK